MDWLFITLTLQVSTHVACHYTQAVKNLNPLICRFYFLDGKAKAMGVDPSATAHDVIRALAEKIELQNVDGWALYEVGVVSNVVK